MKNILLSPILGLVFLSLISHEALAADEVGTDHVEVKEVGEPAVRQYLSADAKSADTSAGENNLMIMAGTFASSSSYEWKGGGKRTAVGVDNYGVTYLFETWHNVDVNFRAELTDYHLDDQRPTKLSFLPLFTVPMIETDIPWYVGLGAGAGVFLKQIDGYSPVSLDYQLVTGLRFPKMIENAGLVLEVGVKNQLLLFSAGQLNAIALNVGATVAF